MAFFDFLCLTRNFVERLNSYFRETKFEEHSTNITCFLERRLAGIIEMVLQLKREQIAVGEK